MQTYGDNTIQIKHMFLKSIHQLINELPNKFKLRIDINDNEYTVNNNDMNIDDLLNNITVNVLHLLMTFSN